MDNKYYLCLAGCNVAFSSFSALVMHYNGKHKEEKAPRKEECEVEELPEDYILKETLVQKKEEVKAEAQTVREPVTTTPKAVYKEMPEPTNILFKILSEFPGLNESVITEILSWTEYKGPLHPMEVKHLLSQMAGVPKGAAEIIPQKYQLALQKAANEGSAEVQMALSGWPMQGFGQQGGMQPMMPIWQNPYQQNPMMQQPFNPFFQPQYLYPNQPPSPPISDKLSKHEEMLDERLDSLENAVKSVIQRITQTEEEKRQAAIEARFDKLESALLEIANKPRTDEGESKTDKVLDDLRRDLAEMRQETQRKEISQLQETLTSLREEVAGSRQDRIDKLEQMLQEVKEVAGKPAVVGRTEMDVVASVLDKSVDKLSEAGRDIKAIATSGATRERFNPERKTDAERAKAGEHIAKAAEVAAHISGKEQELIKNLPLS